MSSGGRKFNEMHTAHRYRDISCAGCGQAFLAYGQRKICDDCKASKSQTPEAIQKLSAQRAAKEAVRKGILIRQRCVICVARQDFNDDKVHGHHEDYSKPMDVIWLCSFHHIKRHEQLNHRRTVKTAAELVQDHINESIEFRKRYPTAIVSPMPWDEPA